MYVGGMGMGMGVDVNVCIFSYHLFFIFDTLF